MSFYKKQNSSNIDYYKKYLQLAGSLSQLFSESKIPLLYYRAAEKVFCKAFFAEDISRSDIAVDARKSKTGIGVKTFIIGNLKTFQKVAEFNSAKPLYDKKPLNEKVAEISRLRNERIAFTENVLLIDKSIYHCVVRSENKFCIFEEPLEKINIEDIKDIEETKSSIHFNDCVNEYSFLKSKSTLTKRFVTTSFIDEIIVDILDDPLEALKLLINNNFKIINTKKYETIYLPLYGQNKTVFEKSGLNQWNAAGRKRDANEVYIPIPAIIHKLFPNFFPDRDHPFALILPNGKELQSKVCQAGNKALMSYSNKELGQWILRDVLELKEGELLTYDKLQTIGIGAVRIDKLDDLRYEINFSKIGLFEKFLKEKIGR